MNTGTPNVQPPPWKSQAVDSTWCVVDGNGIMVCYTVTKEIADFIADACNQVEHLSGWRDFAVKINQRNAEAEATLPPVRWDQQIDANDGQYSRVANQPAQQTTDETGTRGNPDLPKSLGQLENELRKAEK